MYLIWDFMSHIRYTIVLKVFGKGFGEEAFLRKVCPEKKGAMQGKILYKCRSVGDALIVDEGIHCRILDLQIAA